MDTFEVGNNQELALFTNAPVLDLEIPDFDEALDRAVLDAQDELAFSAMKTHIERARDNGDIERLFEMSMVIGAMACMHDHMREFSENFDMMKDGHNEHDGHDHGESSEKSKKSKKNDKKKKRTWFFASVG